MATDSRLKTQYTESYINEFIEKCIGNESQTFEILYTNSSYIRATNPSNLNDKAWWYSYDIRNYRCSSFLLLTGYSDNKYTTFAWNMIIDVTATRTYSQGEDVRDYVKIYNWTLGINLPENKYTILKRNPEEPQFFVAKSYTGSVDYVYKLFYGSNELNPDPNSSKPYYFKYYPENNNVAKLFLKDLCYDGTSGTDYMATSDYTPYITYRFIFCHRGNTTVKPSDLLSSSITTYTNMCYIIPPKNINSYVHELENHIYETYGRTACNTLSLYDNNEELNWNCNKLVLSYTVSGRLFTVFYRLDFDENKIKYIETYKFNGYDMKCVCRVNMSRDFTATYKDGDETTEAGESVSESEIELDVTLKYKADATNGMKYSFVYKDLWYNHVNEPGEPTILCIILIK